ncbi:TPM domain-containing protein [Mycobacterium sp. Aquia_216]|uniref:TPM domain-containing protein n=1 Tax=Mycobacterium sp. Aquia_216 TaxID=2991729 RepID=UPI00227B75C5|nr:TPM domain-containing protein [Mycobacterium sp. Aquia_216]WAJ43597.1 TPM domain-containing protein [Mycobacterium sp. Aquia_216]
MRTGRLLGVILTTLITGLLVAPAADAQPPFRLPGYVTDNAGALSPSGHADVSAAIDKLYADRHIRLWVVYVDDFSGQNAMSWAQRTVHESDLGTYDAVLAVATTGRAYAFLVPSGVKGVTQTQVDQLRRNEIEPDLRDGDWRGAAVSAANGLNATPNSSNRFWLLGALGVIVLAVVALVLVTRYRRRRRRTAELAAARRVDPTDPTALAAVPLGALDDLSRSMVVAVDNAVRTSSNELALAIDEFGAERTEPFTRAVNNAKAALSEAFTVRQQLDDTTPETPAQQRQLLTQVIVSAAGADRELEAQTEAFEQLRDLVVNAESKLDALTQQVVELTSRIEPAEQRLAELNTEFGPAALTSVSGNISTTKERLAFADRNISSARTLAGNAVSGQQGGLVDAVRAAESALGQARALLDAVDNVATDIRRAVEKLPAVLTDTKAGIAHAAEQLHGQNTKSPHISELVAARDAATRAVDAAGGGSADPLGTFAALAKADAELNRVLATLAKERADAERLNRSLEQALFTAQARVRGVSDYIDTRRGSIGPDARTRLAEAQRHLEAAEATKSTNPAEAIAHANAASTLAANAQSLANADVVSAQRAYTGRGGNDTGAMLGGIIIGDLLGGGIGGGFGGWSPASFGGSSNSSPGGSDGGFMGGGGRF